MDEIFYAVFIVRVWAIMFILFMLTCFSYWITWFGANYSVIDFHTEKAIKINLTFGIFYKAKKKYTLCVGHMCLWHISANEILYRTFCFSDTGDFRWKLFGSSGFQQYWDLTESTLHKAINAHYVSVSNFTDLI